MAKSRAQRKAEQRKRREQERAEGAASSDAQHRTQVPESGEVAGAEAALEAGAAEANRETSAPAPSRADVGRPGPGEEPKQLSRREQRRLDKQEAERVRAAAERRAPKQARVEKERGAIAGFFSSVVRELQKVQWPDRDTLIQASAVTLLFVAVAAAYLGVLDAIFSRVVDLLIA